MSEPVSTPIQYPLLLIPEALAKYDFNCNSTKRDMIILTFCMLKSEEDLRQNIPLRNQVLEEALGSRFREYLKEILKSGLNPVDESLWNSCVPHYFESKNAAYHVDRILQYL